MKVLQFTPKVRPWSEVEMNSLAELAQILSARKGTRLEAVFYETDEGDPMCSIGEETGQYDACYTFARTVIDRRVRVVVAAWDSVSLVVPTLDHAIVRMAYGEYPLDDQYLSVVGGN